MLIFLSMLDDPQDARRFTKLYYHYEGLAFYVAKQILKDDSLAEDAVQEAFTRIAKNFSKISKKDPIECNKTKSFIVIIVERVTIDIYRKQKKIWQNELPSDELEKTTFVAEDLKLEEENRVYEAIRSLPKKYGEVLMLRYVNGLNTKEIAGYLGMNESTVRTNLARGKRQLEQLLISCFPIQ